MSVIFLVLPLALLIVAGAVVAFVWSARSGQFDDLDTPAMRVLHDEGARTTSSGSVQSAGPNSASSAPDNESGS